MSCHAWHSIAVNGEPMKIKPMKAILSEQVAGPGFSKGHSRVHCLCALPGCISPEHWFYRNSRMMHAWPVASAQGPSLQCSAVSDVHIWHYADQ